MGFLRFQSYLGQHANRAPTLTSADHPLALVDSEPPSSLPPSPNLQEIGLHGVTCHHLPLPAGQSAQNGSLLIASIEEASDFANRQLPEPSAIIQRLAVGSLLASDDLPGKGNLAIQDNSPAENIVARVTTRPGTWFCHKCHNGPQSIALCLQCVGMTDSGICGHEKCQYCRTE